MTGGANLALGGFQLDRVCPACGGTGSVFDKEMREDAGCGECDCVGFQLTLEGQAIIDLIRRHLGFALTAVSRHEQRCHR